MYRDELYINIGNIAVKAQKSDISARKELLAPPYAGFRCAAYAYSAGVC